MRPLTPLALSFVLTIAVTILADPVNLVVNPTFQEAGKPNCLPRGWSSNIRKGKFGTPVCHFESSLEGVDDRAAVKITVPQGAGTKALAEIVQTIPVKPQTLYYFAVYLRKGAGQCTVSAVSEERNVQRKQVGYAIAQLIGPEAAPGQYALYETEFRTGEQTRFVSISLRLQNLGWGEAWFDAVTLFELPPR